MTHKLTRHETPKTAMLRVFGATALAFLLPLGIEASASARRALVAILAIATLAVLAACQTGGSAGLVQTVNAVDGLISFEGAKFINLAARRLRFKDAWRTDRVGARHLEFWREMVSRRLLGYISVTNVT